MSSVSTLGVEPTDMLVVTTGMLSPAEGNLLGVNRDVPSQICIFRMSKSKVRRQSCLHYSLSCMAKVSGSCQTIVVVKSMLKVTTSSEIGLPKGVQILEKHSFD